MTHARARPMPVPFRASTAAPAAFHPLQLHPVLVPQARGPRGGGETARAHPPPPFLAPNAPLPQQRPFAFSDPFIMRLAPEETVGQLRDRVQRMLGIPDEEFEGSWKPVLCT